MTGPMILGGARRAIGGRRWRIRGQSLVEFAVAVPVFLMLVLGTMDFGRAVIIATTLANAAREGARYASLAPTDTGGIVAAAQREAILPSPSSLTIVVSFPNGSNASGNPVQVTAIYQLHFLTSAVIGVPRGGVTLTARSQMIIE